MNEIEYDSRMAILKEEYNKKCKGLRIDYVKGNTTIMMGDIIKDHIGSIRVIAAGVNIHHSGYPEAKFYGTCLRKDLTPRKDKSKRWVFACNM